MGKAKWWVCESCKSLNDLPANKCYKCRAAKTANPSLFDDQYSEVGHEQQRVGITVDLAQVADLSRPDPLETQTGGTIMEAFGHEDDEPLEMHQTSGPGSERPANPPGPLTPPPMREPTPRGIDAIGGRPWAEDLPPLPEAAAPPASAPQPAASLPGAPPPGTVPPGAPPPGTVPPPQAGPPLPPPAPGPPQAPDIPPPPGYAPPSPPLARPAMPLPPGAPMPPPGAPMPPLPPGDPEADE